MTDAQGMTLARLLYAKTPYLISHGGCVGADEEFHSLVKKICPDARVVCHLGDMPTMRSNFEGEDPPDVTREPQPNLERNRTIVNWSDELIATPKEFEEVRRSGTWATIRYAKDAGIPVTIIFPDGTMQLR